MSTASISSATSTGPPNPFNRNELLSIALIAACLIVLIFGMKLYFDTEAKVVPHAPLVVAPDKSATCPCKTPAPAYAKPFRVTCPHCRFDLTVMPPNTGEFGAVAKTGNGQPLK